MENHKNLLIKLIAEIWPVTIKCAIAAGIDTIVWCIRRELGVQQSLLIFFFFFNLCNGVKYKSLDSVYQTWLLLFIE